MDELVVIDGYLPFAWSFRRCATKPEKTFEIVTFPASAMKSSEEILNSLKMKKSVKVVLLNVSSFVEMPFHGLELLDRLLINKINTIPYALDSFDKLHSQPYGFWIDRSVLLRLPLRVTHLFRKVQRAITR